MRDQAPVVPSVHSSITFNWITQQVLVAHIQRIVTYLLDSNTQSLNNWGQCRVQQFSLLWKDNRNFSWLGSFFIADIFVISASTALSLVFPVLSYFTVCTVIILAITKKMCNTDSTKRNKPRVACYCVVENYVSQYCVCPLLCFQVRKLGTYPSKPVFYLSKSPKVSAGVIWYSRVFLGGI